MMAGTVVLTGPTIQNAFLAGVHTPPAKPAATQPTARSLAAMALVNPSARLRKDVALNRQLESAAAADRARDRGIQARDPRGREAFEAELEARVDPVDRRGARKRRGRRHWNNR